MSWSSTRVAIVATVMVCTGLAIGVLIGHFAIPKNSPSPIEDQSVVSSLMKEVNSENIKENLKQLSMKPHIAGREQDEVVLVDMIKQRWLNHGFDSVRVYSYDVLLSYPIQNDSNYVAVVNESGEYDVSQRKELVIDPEQNDPNVVDPFNAYSAPGEPVGDLVYVNYGTIEDFMFLNRTMSISTEGKICIARYGQIFRGDKVIHAQQYGCCGLIIYSDPADYSEPWGNVYPDGLFLPPTGVQRGTLWVDDGDPQTPNYPSIPTAWRVPEKDLRLPKIPVTPIGYIDAVKYLEKLGGPKVNESWAGDLNITYRYGPGFQSEFKQSQMKMSVKTRNVKATTHNVIGYIKGEIEPDRYVILGNHRDAWVFGAIDPSSGTAVLLEIARAFGQMVKGRNWRPRRTIVFCSWGAEEYGLIGSTEWVEELQKELQARAVAYLNVDSAVTGNFSFSGSGVSSLRDVVFEATKLVKNSLQSEIDAGRTSIYDSWLDRWPDPLKSSNIPYFGSLGSGSDFTPFLQLLGISSIGFFNAYDKVKGYPVYHSVYETIKYVSTYNDPDFTIHQAIGQVWAEIGRNLADSVVLPMDCRLYSDFVAERRDALIKGFGQQMAEHDIDLTQLDDAIITFKNSANQFHDRIESLNMNNPLEVRCVNDQLMQLERAFIDQNPLLGRTAYRHVISAPSLHNTYGNTAFPGITDALFDIDKDPDQEGRWNEVKRQYSIVIFHIISAAATLDPVIP